MIFVKIFETLTRRRYRLAFGKHVLMVTPTGSGKTTIALVALDLLNRVDDGQLVVFEVLKATALQLKADVEAAGLTAFVMANVNDDALLDDDENDESDAGGISTADGAGVVTANNAHVVIVIAEALFLSKRPAYVAFRHRLEQRQFIGVGDQRTVLRLFIDECHALAMTLYRQCLTRDLPSLLNQLANNVPILFATATPTAATRQCVGYCVGAYVDVCLIEKPSSRYDWILQYRTGVERIDVMPLVQTLLQIKKGDIVLVFCDVFSLTVSIVEQLLHHSNEMIRAMMSNRENKTVHFYNGALTELDKASTIAQSRAGQIAMAVLTDAATLGTNFSAKALRCFGFVYGAPADAVMLSQKIGRLGRNRESTQRVVLHWIANKADFSGVQRRYTLFESEYRKKLHRKDRFDMADKLTVAESKESLSKLSKHFVIESWANAGCVNATIHSCFVGKNRVEFTD